MMKVVQCWDDGVVNDIRVTELLRKYNAKATFNLNPGLMKPERVPSHWKTLGEPGWSYRGYAGGKVGLNELTEIYDGFEVASHCWKHESAGKVSDEEFLKCAMDARKYLEDVFQRECHGFAWPNGTFTPTTCDLLLEAGFEYGRTTLNVDDVCAYEHPMALHSNCHYMDSLFIDKYNAAKAAGCKYFYFWGHSYEMFEYDKLWEQFEMKIKMITDDPDTEWANVIDLVRETKKN